MRSLVGAALGTSAALLCTPFVEARPTGIATTDCSGCHGAASSAIVAVSASPTTFEPGEDVTFTVTVHAEQGAAADAGIFVSWPSSGELYTLSGAGLTLVSGTGLVHSQPMATVDGVASFRFGYRAPAEPGGVTFDVGALAGNGDGRISGDSPGRARYLAAFGCEGVTYYADLDRDGYGSKALNATIGCAGVAPPDGFASASGDCNENSATIHPDAAELCNQKDDDCDGEIDEDSEPVELFPDPDGDGYYGLDAGTSRFGCVGMRGYAAEGGDCLPANEAVSPGGTEVCNGLDDDCDGQMDERVLPQCGVGSCRRESDSCSSACTPGTPQPERCNYADDDCNGDADDGTPCPAGSACLDGRCVTLECDSCSAGGSAGMSGGAGNVSGGGAGNVSGGGGTDMSTAGFSGRGGAPGEAGSSAGSAHDPDGAKARGCNVGRGRVWDSCAASLVCGLLLALRRRRLLVR